MGSRQGLPAIAGKHVPLENYPDNLQTEAIERMLVASLPVIAGLDGANLSDEHRLQVYEEATALERRAFIQVHGDAFGCDVTQDDNHMVLIASKVEIEA